MIRTRKQGDTPFFPNMLNNGAVEVCLKEDVDKYIAEMGNDIRELTDIRKELIIANMNLQRRITHKNYVVASALANWCNSEGGALARTPRNTMNARQRWEDDTNYWYRWRTVWYEWAQKYKEFLDDQK